MKRAVFLNVDDTLLIPMLDDNGDGKKILNQALLEQLKALNLRDIYLFTSMGLSDVEGTDNFNQITQKKLTDTLVKQGFKIHDFITPTASNSTQELTDDREKQQRFTCSAHLIDKNPYIDSKSTVETKKAMFNYFLKQKPLDLKSIIYIDNDDHYLQTVKAELESDSVQSLQSLDLSILYIDAKAVLAPNAMPTVETLDKHTTFFLTQYLAIRQEEHSLTKSQYNSFWARIFSTGHQASSKILAAQKCLALLAGQSQLFTAEELHAIKNGRLKNIITTNPKLNDAIDNQQNYLSTLKFLEMTIKPQDADCKRIEVKITSKAVIHFKEIDKRIKQVSPWQGSMLQETLVSIPLIHAKEIFLKLNKYNSNCLSIESLCVEKLIDVENPRPAYR